MPSAINLSELFDLAHCSVFKRAAQSTGNFKHSPWANIRGADITHIAMNVIAIGASGDKNMMHTHPTSSLGMITSGSGRLEQRVNGQVSDLPLETGDMIAIPAEVPHCLHADGSMIIFSVEFARGDVQGRKPLETAWQDNLG